LPPPGLDVAVERVVTRVERAAEVPADVDVAGVVGDVADAPEGLEPVEALGLLAPEPLGVVHGAAVEVLVLLHRGDEGAAPDAGGRGVDGGGGGGVGHGEGRGGGRWEGITGESTTRAPPPAAPLPVVASRRRPRVPLPVCASVSRSPPSSCWPPASPPLRTRRPRGSFRSRTN